MKGSRKQFDIMCQSLEWNPNTNISRLDTFGVVNVSLMLKCYDYTVMNKLVWTKVKMYLN